MSEIELLACPFCDFYSEIIEASELSDPDPIYHVECWRCGARGPVEDSSDKAVKSWNRRALSAPQGEARRERGEDVRILSRALMASLRWSYMDTAECVHGKKKMDGTYADTFVRDVQFMQAGLEIARLAGLQAPEEGE